ncbi:uncharacterized protein LOC117176633 [Belonocnema kinseyi]|uniref:uncharacterized protein LOC117176633 n=1 Tax=Belonocnema kinseyi TaxID=2817044 RepID=UPI00143DA9F1|nr:uncharacterized protein LOC117176633 [Belonocnema kinseyi]
MEVYLQSPIIKTENVEKRDNESEPEQDDEFDLEAESASKQRRRSESADRQRRRGRLRKTVPAAKSSYKWSEEEPDRRGRRSSGQANFSATTKNEGAKLPFPYSPYMPGSSLGNLQLL